MVILSGKTLKDELIEDIKKDTDLNKLSFYLYSDKDSIPSYYYIKGIKKNLDLFGIPYTERFYNSEISSDENLEILKRESSGKFVILARPLKYTNDAKFISNILPEHDPDMVTSSNVMRVYQGNMNYLPATVQSVKYILEKYNLQLSGKRSLVVGRSATIGKPCSMYLLSLNSTVTIAHSHTTKDQLNDIASKSDYIFLASGKQNLIDRSSFNKKSVVIDCGFSKNGGDLGFIPDENELSAYTPVPGGVGALTSLFLIKNALYLANAR